MCFVEGNGTISQGLDWFPGPFEIMQSSNYGCYWSFKDWTCRNEGSIKQEENHNEREGFNGDGGINHVWA